MLDLDPRQDPDAGECFFCGEPPYCDLFGAPGNELDCTVCCESSYNAYYFDGWSWEDIYGRALHDSVTTTVGLPDARGLVPGHRTSDLAVRWKLRVEFTKSRKLVKEFIRQHHVHNAAPPAGDRARFLVWNGPTLIGVAMLGNPAARNYARVNPLHLEVRRVAVRRDVSPALARNACSMLYGACVRWARENGFQRVLTFIREEELGASCKAAGFVLDEEHTPKSGDWSNRAGRNYGKQAPKARWIKET